MMLTMMSRMIGRPGARWLTASPWAWLAFAEAAATRVRR
jgi:hypothetical protein